MKGTKESALLNTIMVLIKVAVVVLFLIVGVMYVKPENWSPFMPFGFAGVATGAATVFFAFIGFDAVSSAAEEVRNPQRDMPIGIISSLLVCTILYIAVSLTLTGIVPYLNQDWVAGFISLGAIVGITTVLLVMMYGQARMFFAMSRDSLLPELFSHVHPRTQVPQKSTLVVAALVATFGGLLPLSSLAQLTNIGTLFAFILVSIGLVVLRRTHPQLSRVFRVPFVPLLAVFFCGYLVFNLPTLTKVGFLGWLSVGAIVYFLYGRKHSRLATKDDSSQT